MWAQFYFELRASLIIFRIFVLRQRLIAKNVDDNFLSFSLTDTFMKLVESMTWVEGPFWAMKISSFTR